MCLFIFTIILLLVFFFFFQAEDGIRDHCVTGVQTCALPICIAKDPDDHAARIELAKALAGRGAFKEASDQLLTSIERDREWDEGAARKQLLTVFEAAGQGSDVARLGRRRLSSILFS